MAVDVRTRLGVSQEQLADFCRKWKIERLELFGSVLRDDFEAERSDVDILVTLAPGVRQNFRQRLAMEDQLSELLGRAVDVSERCQIEGMENWIRRKDILSSARTLFEA